MSNVIQKWQEQIRHASDNKTAITICGSGSKSFYGHAEVSAAVTLDTTEHRGIVSYEPAELVLTVNTGTPLKEVEQTLLEQKQMLAFEPPAFGGNATIGGCIATGLSGPRRTRVGPLRDFVLGTKLINGKGQELEFGGQVMKNVAGYDVSRLLAGSLGILGVLTEVSLKVLPLPEKEVSVQFESSQDQALKIMRQWAGESLPVSATTWYQGILTVRLSGATSVVESTVKSLREEHGGELIDGDASQSFWASVKEQQHSFFDKHKNDSLWRFALPASATELSLIAGQDTLLEWNGLQRWVHCPSADLSIRDKVVELGGHATLFRRSKADIEKDTPVFTPLNNLLLGIHTNLKNEFDPQGIFNSGRMYPNL